MAKLFRCGSASSARGASAGGRGSRFRARGGNLLPSTPMKLLMTCDRCTVELLEAGLQLGSNEFEQRHWFQHVDVNDEGFYRVTCPKGHSIACALSNRIYELLFDRAGSALLDGYYREAIATFASALERFFEFYTRVVARNRGIPEQAIARFWKPIGARSERQLGAFYLAYLVQNQSEFPGVQQKMEELRNSVVHKGVFATEQDARSYGAYVYDTICSLLDAMRQDMAEALEAQRTAEYQREVETGIARTKHQGNVGGMGLVTMIHGFGSTRRTFEESLDHFGRHNPWNIGGYSTRLGTLAQASGMTVRQFLAELASGRYASAFRAAPPLEGAASASAGGKEGLPRQSDESAENAGDELKEPRSDE